MDKLREHLCTEYTVDSRNYRLLQIAFLNDYHRACKNELLGELYKHDREKAGKAMMAKLIGSALYTVNEWILHIDPTLYSLIQGRYEQSYFVAYMGMQSALDSADKLADIIHGEGYVAGIQQAVDRLNNSTPA